MDDATTATETPQQTQAIGDNGEAGWAAAAAPAAAPNPAQAALTAAQNPDPSKAPQTEQPTLANNNMGAPPMPLALRPVRRGLLGIVDKMADVLTGDTKPEIYEDGQGDKYVMHPNMGHGEQWARIGAGLLEGAARGYAAGQGAGGQGRAGVAGIEAGKQLRADQHNQETQMTDEVRQDMLDRANAQMTRMKLAEQTWKLSRLQIDADQADADRAENHATQYRAMGGEMVGHMPNPAAISEVLKTTPDISKHMVQNGTVNIVPHYDTGDSGQVKRNGFDVYLMKDGWRKQVLPAGSTFDWYNPQTHEIEKHNASDAMTAGEQADRNGIAANARDGFLLQQHKQQQEDAQAHNLESETKARDKELPGKIAETAARTNQANAAADKDRANAAAIKAGSLNADGTPNPRFEALAQAVEAGHVLGRNLKREAKGSGLDPNAIMARAVEIGNEKGRPFSEPIIEEEHKFASNEKTQAAIGGIDRILDPKTGYMSQMMKTAEQAHLGTHGLYNSAELATRRFFGETSAKNFQTGVTELRRSIAGLIGNPLLGGSETDKKLQQADELIGEKPTLENLRGAAVQLNSALAAQRAKIVGSNRFLIERYGSTPGGAPAAPAQQQQTAPAAQAAPPRPATVPPGYGWNPQGNNGRGSWDPPQQPR